MFCATLKKGAFGLAVICNVSKYLDVTAAPVQKQKKKGYTFGDYLRKKEQKQKKRVQRPQKKLRPSQKLRPSVEKETVQTGWTKDFRSEPGSWKRDLWSLSGDWKSRPSLTITPSTRCGLKLIGETHHTCGSSGFGEDYSPRHFEKASLRQKIEYVRRNIAFDIKTFEYRHAVCIDLEAFSEKAKSGNIDNMMKDLTEWMDMLVDSHAKFTFKNVSEKMKKVRETFGEYGTYWKRFEGKLFKKQDKVLRAGKQVAVYTGWTKDNKRSGYGTLSIGKDTYDKNNKAYHGQWKEGKAHGYGKMVLPNGNTFFCENWKNGEMHGRYYGFKPSQVGLHSGYYYKFYSKSTYPADGEELLGQEVPAGLQKILYQTSIDFHAFEPKSTKTWIYFEQHRHAIRCRFGCGEEREYEDKAEQEKQMREMKYHENNCLWNPSVQDKFESDEDFTIRKMND